MERLLPQRTAYLSNRSREPTTSGIVSQSYSTTPGAPEAQSNCAKQSSSRNSLNEKKYPDEVLSDPQLREPVLQVVGRQRFKDFRQSLGVASPIKVVAPDMWSAPDARRISVAAARQYSFSTPSTRLHGLCRCKTKTADPGMAKLKCGELFRLWTFCQSGNWASGSLKMG